MIQEIKDRCDIFVGNTRTIQKVFPDEPVEMVRAMALLFAGQGLEPDREKWKEGRQILKEGTSLFSEYRSDVNLLLIGRMLLQGEKQQEYLERVKNVYRKLHRSKWAGDDYKIMAAAVICEKMKGNDIEEAAERYVQRTNEIYAEMKRAHKWLVSEEDIPFAALAATAEPQLEGWMEAMEQAYQTLKTVCRNKNSAWRLSRILAVDVGGVETNCQKVLRIAEELKVKKHGYRSEMELAVLGEAAMLKAEEAELADMMIEAEEYLKKQKGFRLAGISGRRFYAAQLVFCAVYGSEELRRKMIPDSPSIFALQMDICMTAGICAAYTGISDMGVAGICAANTGIWDRN